MSTARAATAITAMLLACVPARSPLIEAGANVELLPDGTPGPEPCPNEALTVMKALLLRPGATARVEIDANQIKREPLTVFAGPVESITLESMGALSGAARLYGRIWTGQRRVVIRYYRAQQPGGEVIPICAVARKGWGQLEAKPGPFPRRSAELEFSTALAFIVEDYL